ncbi:MAG: DUF4198 domain-containing protein [Gemmataceae bacterium]
MRIPSFTVWFCLLGVGGTASAHFAMLLPHKSALQRGETVTITYQWGHPFEHQFFDAPAPEYIFALSPSHDTLPDQLTERAEKVMIDNGEGKKVTAYRWQFTPKERGDYVLVLRTEPVWMEEEEEFVQETVSVVIHVQAQRGWDRDSGAMIPLTRPYGLLPGMVFQAKAQYNANPLPGVMVEIERYNSAPPAELPPDEFITFTAKTDPNGVVTCTLPEAGWWGVSAAHIRGSKERDGKTYPVRQRVTFWLHVDAKRPSQ